MTYVKINELRHSAHIASRQFVLVGLYQLQVGTFLQVECSDFVHISVKLFERDASRKVCCLDEVLRTIYVFEFVQPTKIEGGDGIEVAFQID